MSSPFRIPGSPTPTPLSFPPRNDELINYLYFIQYHKIFILGHINLIKANVWALRRLMCHVISLWIFLPLYSLKIKKCIILEQKLKWVTISWLKVCAYVLIKLIVSKINARLLKWFINIRSSSFLQIQRSNGFLRLLVKLSLQKPFLSCDSETPQDQYRSRFWVGVISDVLLPLLILIILSLVKNPGISGIQLT